jgi:restriction system protein
MSGDVSEGVPSHRYLLWPVLEAIRALGGSGGVDEINERAIEVGGYSEEQQSVIHGRGPRTELEYRFAWARTHLKYIGALDNSTRGVWSLTDFGREIDQQQVDRLYVERKKERAQARRDREQLELEDVGADDDDEARDWKEQLLAVLLEMPPDAFERLARRILREAGFISVTVTGQSGDGGIDGLGVYRVSLLSFPVFFQCKRYRGSVRASAVRDFRGAMAGRGDKGLLITTGTFTADAKKEATREGAPPVDLVDGDRLCGLLKEYAIGVQSTQRIVEEVAIESSAFDDI